MDDIRAMGGNTAEDERRFATAARVSEINLSNYRKFVQPWVRAAITPQMAERMHQWHPLRVSYEAFGGDTVAMNGVLLFGWSTAVIFEVLRTTLRASGEEGTQQKRGWPK